MITPYYSRNGIDLYLGDCREILPQLTEKVDLVVTSPPYDSLREYGGFCYDFDYKTVVAKLYEVVIDGGIVVWIVGDQVKEGSETGTSFRQALEFMSYGFRLHDTMIYWKNGFAFPESVRYAQNFEYMFVFSSGKPK